MTFFRNFFTAACKKMTFPVISLLYLFPGKKKNKKSGKYNNQYFVFQTQVVEELVKDFRAGF